MHAFNHSSAPAPTGVGGALNDVTGLLPFELAGWLQVSKRFALKRDNEIYQIVYDQLTVIARSVGSRWPNEQTPRRTSLVYDFLLEATAAENISPDDRRHFFNLAATIMRQIFINSARGKLSRQQGNADALVDGDDTVVVDVRSPRRLLLVDRLIDELEHDKPAAAAVFVHRHFARLKTHEIAEVMAMTEAVVSAHLKFANAYIMRHMLEQR